MYQVNTRKLLLVLSGWILTLSITVVVTLSLDEGCDTPGGNAGRCVLVQNCPFLRVLIRNVETPDDRDYLSQFNCGKHSNGKPLICCPELQNEPECGRINLKDNIIGGVETDIDEYPWMAVLAYMNEGGNISFGCGGALISDRFVVTAAHCIEGIGKRKLTFVRLGEWDLSTTEDCNAKGCNEFPHQDFSIAKIIKHENYNAERKNREHDIALLKLYRAAPDIETISTICLPTVEMIKNLDVKHESFDVAGWGSIGPGGGASQRKRKVTLKGRSLDVCQSVYRIARVTFTRNHFCVGGEDQIDSCRGDSGGPLMILKNNRWFMAGVVSLGPPQCGTKGMPGIYTNIGSYLDWLAGKIELES